MKFLSRSLQHGTWCSGLISSIFAHAGFLPAVVSWTRTDLLSTFTHPRRVRSNCRSTRRIFPGAHPLISSHLPSTHAMLLQDTRIAPEQLRIRKIAKKNFGSPIVNQYHQCLTMNRRLTSLRHGWVEYILYLLLEKCVFDRNYIYSEWKRFPFCLRNFYFLIIFSYFMLNIIINLAVIFSYFILNIIINLAIIFSYFIL